MTLRFRRATATDASLLSEFGAATFIDWYLPDNEPENVYRHVRNTYTPERQLFEIEEPGQWALMAFDDGTLAGYGLVRAERPCPGYAAEGLAEIRRFYVGRAWHGSGLARSLMEALTRMGREAGALGFWLTCWERNPRALAFYAKCGFRRVGETTFTVGNDPQTDHLLVLTP
jgi:diamine N-acetyltransferase